MAFKEYTITAKEMHEINAKAKHDVPLFETMMKASLITKKLKELGMQFKPSPDSAFHKELPVNETVARYDASTDSYIYREII